MKVNPGVFVRMKVRRGIDESNIFDKQNIKIGYFSILFTCCFFFFGLVENLISRHDQ